MCTFARILIRIDMKTWRLLISLCAIFCFSSLFAQLPQDEEIGNGLFFPAFEKGFVIFKNGSRSQAMLNYSMLQQKMWFLDSENNIMELANISTVSAVIIGDKRFLPASGGAFYEEVHTGNGSFFIQHKANILSQGKAAGYGGYSQTSAVTSVGSISGGSFEGQGGTFGMQGIGRVELVANEKFKLKKDCIYFIKSGNSYKRFYSAKTLGKLFKGQSAKIEVFAKENAINFTKPEDISKIVAYSYGLMN